MGFLDDITLGRYLAGDSLVHRLDPRLKLCGLPVLIIAVFAARDGLQLAWLALLALAAITLTRIEWRFWGRGLWILRWLFLFTLLLHLFFSPGRTLAGIAWLSQDGLMRGLLVCGQLACAVVFSSLLTLTTSPQELVGALSTLLAPLERFGLAVGEGAMLLLLVLHFIPILREEASLLLEQEKRNGNVPEPKGIVERARVAGRLLEPLIMRLVDRADGLARRLAAGEEKVPEAAVLAPFRRCGAVNLVVLAVGCLWLLMAFEALP